MAREAALWSRIRGFAIPALRERGYCVDLQRVENAATSGHPDVEGCITSPGDIEWTADQLWIELKSEARPARESTPIRPKLRNSQSIWHRQRADAGGRHHWVLLQVGEAHKSRLYLIPGCNYDQLSSATESELATLSRCAPEAPLVDVLLTARLGW